MINNSKKTKEMILESHKNNPLNKLCVGNAEIESVSVFKLLLFVFFSTYPAPILQYKVLSVVYQLWFVALSALLIESRSNLFYFIVDV